MKRRLPATSVLLGIVSSMLLGCSESTPAPDQAGSGAPGNSAHAQFSQEEVNAASGEISEVVDQLFRLLEAGKIEEIYNSSASPRFREVASLEKFQTFSQVWERLGVMKSKKGSQFNLDRVEGKDRATALYQAEFEHGTGQVLFSFERVDGKWMLLRWKLDSPDLQEDPFKNKVRMEILVQDSEPVLPGSMVDLMDSSVSPKKLILENMPVFYVRWRTDGPFSIPKYPASGFITLALTKEQVETVRAADAISVRPHAK